MADWTRKPVEHHCFTGKVVGEERDQYLFHCGLGLRSVTSNEQEANAGRIVACWNACLAVENPAALADVLAWVEKLANEPFSSPHGAKAKELLDALGKGG